MRPLKYSSLGGRDTARKILCTYRVMYSLHVRRMYRANLDVCSQINCSCRREARERGKRHERLGADSENLEGQARR